ncbi:carboxylate-amine ligase [Thermodesulfatator atlanticus]|uniref:carboxylate-amine ligase n=1 Tax=Thermodesulfatator atlanticus TaxID=501497 RepID=UPI0024805D23|nr:YbdK family carboxylate-amine ligase [Thermodesulfatator atlanticus]
MELELEIISRKTFNLTPKGPLLISRAPKWLRPYLKPEAYQSMVELVTPVCETLSEAEAFITQSLHELEKMCQEEDTFWLAASLHPFARALEQKVWGKKRYLRIFEELQIIGRRFIAQGLHVHLGMPDVNAALRVYHVLRLYLPLFLALSTSSPFYEAHPTGFHSYRTKLFEVLPLAGLPRSFYSWEEFESLIHLLTRLKIVEGLRDLWWDIRFQPALGTVEVRICDAPGRLSDIFAIAALMQAMAAKYLHEKPSPGIPYETISFGKWQAARHGICGSMIEPISLKRKDFATVAENLLKELEPYAQSLGSREYLARVGKILERKPISFMMLALFERGANFPEIIASMREEFWK